MLLINGAFVSYYLRKLTSPKVRLFTAIVDVGLSTLVNSLCWPLFLFNLCVRYTAYINNGHDNLYFFVPFLLNPEVYRTTYKLSSHHLNIAPNLYSRRIIFRESKP